MGFHLPPCPMHAGHGPQRSRVRTGSCAGVSPSIAAPASNTTRGATFTSAPIVDDAGRRCLSAMLRNSFAEATMAGAGLTWTKERVDLLTKLWSEGLSASQIAAELGEGVSRNAVISKAHRLGLAHGAPKVASTPRPPKPSRPLEPCPTGETSGQADPALAPTTVNPQPKMKPKEARPERMRLCQPKTLKRPALRWMALCLCRGACRSWTCARGCAAGPWAIRPVLTSATAARVR
jgi:hypothetical protein